MFSCWQLWQTRLIILVIGVKNPVADWAANVIPRPHAMVAGSSDYATEAGTPSSLKNASGRAIANSLHDVVRIPLVFE